MLSQKANTNPALAEAVQQLRLARRQNAETKARLAEARAEFDEHYATLIQMATDEANREAEADRTVRALAVSEYQATGNQAPCEGVSIVLTRQLTYDLPFVTEWAKRSLPDFITPEQLNVKAFEKMARTVRLPFVTITELPSARVASELPDAMEQAA